MLRKHSEPPDRIEACRRARTHRATTATLAIAMYVISGCANPAPTTHSLLAPHANQEVQDGPHESYVLSQKERSLECSTLRGRMKVAILQLKSRNATDQTSGLSRTIHSGVTSVIGGTAHGADPETFYRRETARLHAYNELLKEQDCRGFDLQKELSPVSVS